MSPEIQRRAKRSASAFIRALTSGVEPSDGGADEVNRIGDRVRAAYLTRAGMAPNTARLSGDRVGHKSEWREAQGNFMAAKLLRDVI